MPRFTWTRRNALIVAGALATIVGLLGVTFAVSGNGSPTTTTSSTAAPTTSTSTTIPGTPAPLTGLPVDDAIAQRPALVLKIDNHNANARPQAGINQADVIYEEQVEGGVTRLAAVFQSTDADPVGPIRSGRTTDIQIVTPLNHPLFGFSGANAPTVAAILQAPIIDVRWDARPDNYRRMSGRPAPHNLFTTTAELYASVDDPAGPPPALFSFREKGSPINAAGVQPTTGFDLAFGSSAGYRAGWTWDAPHKAWLRTQIGTKHLDAAGQQVAVQNVIVQAVAYGVRYGNPEAQLVGEGDVWVFTGGKVIQGRWVRPSVSQVTRYIDAAGKEIKLTAGRTWIELPATGRAPVLR